jgi:hypothetical protein
MNIDSELGKKGRVLCDLKNKQASKVMNENCFGEHKRGGEITSSVLFNGGKYEYYVDSNGIIRQAELYVDGNCEIPGGIYYLTKIKMNPNTILSGIDPTRTLTGSGPVKIFCMKNDPTSEGIGIELARNAKIGHEGQSAENFAIECYRMPQIKIAENCRLIGTILAPVCTFNFCGGTQITGAILVGQLKVSFNPPSEKLWFIEFDVSLLEKLPQEPLITDWRELSNAN